MSMRTLHGMLFSLALAALAACEDGGTPDEAGREGARAPAPAPSTAEGASGDTVRVELRDGDGQAVGTATLSAANGGVEVAVRASGLPPGPHGFHIHDTGACEPPSFESAGGHFAPLGRQHGHQNPQGPHVGDLPNLQVGSDGGADTSFVAAEAILQPDGETSLLAGDGTALVIHADEDDQRTDPSGNSGDRIACGVVGER